ncbi:hypothetical protein B0H19DRAFT_1374147 [Mycena capillaripes]|nr:hypothetical protein B0H19DRAFT_1374147 [Mycena capillaripes]
MPHDYRKNQARALEYARILERRGAVDYGVPQPNMPPIFVTPSMCRGLAPLPTLSDDAPSRWHRHPYAIMHLENYGTGNCPRPPHPSQCAECKMDTFIEAARQEYPNAVVVVPDIEFKGPKPGAPVFVNFHYEGDRNPGVLVTDVLAFNARMVQPHYMLVRQPLGPIKVTLRIEGSAGGEVEDLLFANCMHRAITRFNLAWVLAFSFRVLAEKTFRLSVKDLALMCLYSRDGSEWIAVARYIHRIDC